MSYQNILKEDYSKVLKFCNILELLSDELVDYSALIKDEDSWLSMYVSKLSNYNRQFAKAYLGCYTNNDGVIDIKPQSNELMKTLHKNFHEKQSAMEKTIMNYIEDMIETGLVETGIDRSDHDAVLAFVDVCEATQHHDMLRSIYNKYQSIMD